MVFLSCLVLLQVLLETGCGPTERDPHPQVVRRPEAPAKSRPTRQAPPLAASPSQAPFMAILINASKGMLCFPIKQHRPPHPLFSHLSFGSAIC